MPRHSTRRSRLSVAVTAVVLPAGSTAGGAYLVDRASEAAPAAGTAVSSAPGASEQPEVDLDAELAAAGVPPAGVADVSVAVRAVDGGADAVYGAARRVRAAGRAPAHGPRAARKPTLPLTERYLAAHYT
ncbi:hypothetical protein [Streptomyces halstedii]|uniref:hypothetical protein n=1 Tax=Streptomyces halstedii TaxID=1944 RepID=UPI00345FB94C